MPPAHFVVPDHLNAKPRIGSHALPEPMMEPIHHQQHVPSQFTHVASKFNDEDYGDENLQLKPAAVKQVGVVSYGGTASQQIHGKQQDYNTAVSKAPLSLNKNSANIFLSQKNDTNQEHDSQGSRNIDMNELNNLLR